jgi:hypothetical protein
MGLAAEPAAVERKLERCPEQSPGEAAALRGSDGRGVTNGDAIAMTGDRCKVFHGVACPMRAEMELALTP